MSEEPGPFKIVMIRHGETDQKTDFCGWFDADLSEQGRDKAVTAGKILKADGYEFDIAHTSVLRRAQKTLNLVLQEIGQQDIPISKNWQLNERHYGGLTGLSESETAAKYGEIQLQIWRRSFHVPSPPMDKDHPYYETIMHDSRYAYDPTPAAVPKSESLKLTIDRTLLYWNDVIVPQIKEGQRVIISGHLDSLRGIVKQLDGRYANTVFRVLAHKFYCNHNWIKFLDLDETSIMELNIPSGIPFVYELDTNMKPIDQVTYLGNKETLRKAMGDTLDDGI